MSNNFLNTISLVGRLGSDPEIKYFESGTVLSKLSLAVKRKKDKSKPDWFALEIWVKLAEIAGEYSQKGSLIAVKGELKIDEWTDKTSGQKRSRPYVTVNWLELLSSKSNLSDNPEDLSAF